MSRLSNTPCIKRSFWHGTAWSFISTALARGSAIIASIIVARILGTEGYGKLGLIQSTVGMLGVFAGFGLGTTTTRYVAQYRENDPQRAGGLIVFNVLAALCFSGLVATVVLIFSGWFSSAALVDPLLSAQIPNLAVLLVLSTVSGVLNGTMAGFQAFRKQAFINCVIGILSLPVTVLLVRSHHLDGAVSALSVTVGMNVLGMALSLGRLCRQHRVPLGFQGIMRDASLLYRFALPLLISTALNIPIIWFTNTFLARQPDGFSGLGIINAANQWRAAILFLPMVISPVALPMLTKAVTEQDGSRMGAVLRLNMRVVGLTSLGLWLAISAFSGWIVRLYGEGFSQGQLVVIVLTLAASLQAINGIVGQIIAAFEKPWLGVMLNGAWALALVSTSLVLIPRYGALGYASAQVVSFALHTIWQSVFVLHIYRAFTRKAAMVKLISQASTSNA